MSLTVLPGVERLTLAIVEAVPEWHPEHATFEPFPVYAWLVRHPDGPILVDTGVGIGHSVINEWYRPRVTEIGEALGAVGIDVSDLASVVLSHLHFDHCGQQAALEAPVYVQSAEQEAAQADGYTVLRFTTAVDAAASRGVAVYPYRWRDESAAAFADGLGAELADGSDGRPSLSPISLLRLERGARVVLPSPNGSTCAALGSEAGATVVAACLRNAAAVAVWLDETATTVTVIACGERWPDGSLRLGRA